MRAVVFALLLAAAPAQAEPREPAILSGHATVIDGDTLRIGGLGVRIKGIAAPEVDEPGGAAATAALRAMIGDRAVRCVLTGETTHKRGVGWCSAGAVDLNRSMVRDGWALACPRWDERGYAALEAAARRRGGEVYRIAYALPDYCKQPTRARKRPD